MHNVRNSKCRYINPCILKFTHSLTHWPVVIDMFGDVGCRVVGREEEFFRLPAD